MPFLCSEAFWCLFVCAALCSVRGSGPLNNQLMYLSLRRVWSSCVRPSSGCLAGRLFVVGVCVPSARHPHVPGSLRWSHGVVVFLPRYVVAHHASYDFFPTLFVVLSVTLFIVLEYATLQSKCFVLVGVFTVGRGLLSFRRRMRLLGYVGYTLCLGDVSLLPTAVDAAMPRPLENRRLGCASANSARWGEFT